MLRITGPQTPAEIERELDTLRTTHCSLLQLPVRPKNWWLGGEQGLVQLAITWARMCDRPTLVTHIHTDEDPTAQLSSMAQRLFGFTAMLMAAEIVNLSDGLAIDSGGDTTPLRSLRPAAYHQCRRIVEMMHQPVSEFALGAKVFLVSVDHSSLWPIPWLYSPDKLVLDRIAFVSLAHDLFRKTGAASFRTPSEPAVLSRIGAILHELFKNTHEWARTDTTGTPWRRSVRGIAAEYHTWTLKDCEAIVQSNPALAHYLEYFRDSIQDNRARFLELCVFDSGLGLARRWLGSKWNQTITIAEEFDACLKCVTKHNSTSRKSNRGLGLAEVMGTLNKLRGLVRIRTGRMSLYRDFSNSPQADTNDVALNDFPTRSSSFTQLAPVYGTHYQMLIPLLDREGP